MTLLNFLQDIQKKSSLSESSVEWRANNTNVCFIHGLIYIEFRYHIAYPFNKT